MRANHDGATDLHAPHPRALAARSLARPSRSLLIAALALLTASLGGCESEPGPVDAEVDASLDAGVDAGVDAEADAGDEEVERCLEVCVACINESVCSGYCDWDLERRACFLAADDDCDAMRACTAGPPPP